MGLLRTCGDPRDGGYSRPGGSITRDARAVPVARWRYAFPLEHLCAAPAVRRLAHAFEIPLEHPLHDARPHRDPRLDGAVRHLTVPVVTSTIQVLAGVGAAVLLPLSAVTTERMTDVCGEDPSFICREVLNRTDDRGLAELADMLLGTTLTVIAIFLAAILVNRFATRSIKRGLRTLHSGAVRERLGALRRRAPAALQETDEISLRAEQRIEALTSVLRSITTVVIFAIAGIMILVEAGLKLAPLLAGAGIVGVALGFGAQSLVKDFLSGLFILVEDQFGVGDIVDLETGVAGGGGAGGLRQAPPPRPGAAPGAPYP